MPKLDLSHWYKRVLFLERFIRRKVEVIEYYTGGIAVHIFEMVTLLLLIWKQFAEVTSKLLSKFGLKHRYKVVRFLVPFIGWKMKFSKYWAKILKPTFYEWSRDWYQNLNLLVKWLDSFSPGCIWFRILACLLVSDANFAYFEYVEFFQLNIQLEKGYLYESIFNIFRNYMPNKYINLDDKNPLWLNKTNEKIKTKSKLYKQCLYSIFACVAASKNILVNS